MDVQHGKHQQILTMKEMENVFFLNIWYKEKTITELLFAQIIYQTKKLKTVLNLLYNNYNLIKNDTEKKEMLTTVKNMSP